MRKGTGIKDKDGIEICEGDIVKEAYLRLSGNVESHTLFVKWHKGWSEWVLSNDINNTGYGITSSMGKNGLYKIIGNIYDNPEMVLTEH